MYWDKKELDLKYFETLYSETFDNYEYSVIRPLGNPMILFSKIDGTPLASLHLRCQENYKQKDVNNTRGRALMTKRPDSSSFKCDFQGLIDRDGQEFEFVITNLTDQGYINFNILKKDEKVDTINPGGLNEINELRPNESYAVKCDQADNKSLILKALVKQEKTDLDPEIKLTVKEDEQNKDKLGTYFFLSVVPQIGKDEYKEKFKDTMWACSDMFCIKRKVQSKKYGIVHPQPVPYSTGYPYSLVNNSNNITYRDFGSSVSNRENLARNSGYSIQVGNSYSSNNTFRYGAQTSNSIGSLNASLIKPYSANDILLIDNEINYAKKDARLDESEGGDLGGCLFGEEDGWGSSNKISYDREEYDDDSSEGGDLGGGLFGDDDDVNYVFKGPLGNKGPKGSKGCSGPSGILINTVGNSHKKIIDDSYASKIEKGDHIQVYGAVTGVEYDYDLSAVPCVIGLSISGKIEFEPLLAKENLIDLAKSMVEDMIKNASKQMLERLTMIYKSHQCVICLEGPDEPAEESNLDELDVVFYQCGHQCCHYDCGKNLRDCPLCRGRIAAKLRII